jgi:catechol 2,3-dioxygenase-like lactoylglutathione lyase family enzyme
MQISGYHHVSVPVTNVLVSSDWYERVFGFGRLVIEEQENSVAAAILGHPAGIFLCLHHAPERLPHWRNLAAAVPVLGFKVPGYAYLAAWEQRLTAEAVSVEGV